MKIRTLPRPPPSSPLSSHYSTGSHLTGEGHTPGVKWLEKESRTLSWIHLKKAKAHRRRDSFLKKIIRQNLEESKDPF